MLTGSDLDLRSGCRPAAAPGSSAGLPRPRGPLSGWLLERLGGDQRPFTPADLVRTVADPWGADLHLTLHLLHELSYRGLPGVSDASEDDLVVTSIRVELESAFERALRRAVPRDESDPVAVIESLCDDPLGGRSGAALAAELRRDVALEQFRELLVHRSVRHLGEADPQSWAVARLDGSARAALVEIQVDEYGGGTPGRSYAELFATTLRELGLDDHPGAHLDDLPAVTLASTNLVRMFGRSRRLLGALVGHVALFECASATSMAETADVLARLGGSPAAREYFEVRATHDARHGRIALDRLVPGIVDGDPARGAEVAFGARALDEVERRVTAHVLGCWLDGRSSLRGREP